MANGDPIKQPDQLGWLPVFLVFALWLFLFFLGFQTPQIYRPQRSQHLTIEEILTRSGRDLEHEDLISQIRQDLKITSDLNIKIFVGPYENISGEGRLLKLENHLGFVVLLDEVFYQNLTSEEKISVIAHELGHITNKAVLAHDLDTAIQFQIEADTYATKYASPEAMLSVLNKLIARHGGIKSRQFELRIKNLERIKQSRQGH